MNTRNSHIRERVDANPISACGFTPPLPLLLLTHILINIYSDTNIIQKQLIIGYIDLSRNWKPCLLKCNCSLTSVHVTPNFLFNSTFPFKLVEEKHQAFPRTPWKSKLVEKCRRCYNHKNPWHIAYSMSTRTHSRTRTSAPNLLMPAASLLLPTSFRPHHIHFKSLNLLYCLYPDRGQSIRIFVKDGSIIFITAENLK